MTENQPQKININQEEVSLIKSIFKDNEKLLKATRACMFGLGLTNDEKSLLKSTYSSEPLMKIMFKRFVPRISKDEPIGQISDIWLGVETQVFGHSRDTIYQAVQYKKKAVDLTEQALALLSDPQDDKIDLNFTPSQADDLQIELLARNQYIRHIEQQLLFIKVISEQKDESPIEAAKRLKKDSTK